ncbi:MAG TPA: 2-C-methyl-D-erythritol 2,4-cyclodiphosphate synthase [Gammaproteobacteria bacterium]|nr:2-C-methyl-D-erythritol 2,4-cyclodiphosphate synthase [Gammaproteobacteria bacterium]
MRIGQGFDAHRFRDGDYVMLGGVRVPHDRGLAAHSDGDVLLHAICDALLGAAALGDIGKHFPDTSKDFKGIDSRILLRRTAQILAEAGYRPVNLDGTIIAERPKIAPHVAAMRACIAEDLGLPVDAVSVKATTVEKMGFTGREEGIAASAIALIAPLIPSPSS